MAVNHIPIDPAKRLGGRLRRLADLTRDVLNLLAETKAVMEAQVDAAPDPDDYSAIETLYGLPSGKGQTTYNLVAAAKGVIDVSAVRQMVDWLG